MIAELARIQLMEEKRVYIKMHEMINTKIVSIDGLRYGCTKYNSTDCDELLQIVNR